MVRDQLQQVENNMDVEVQCRLADRNHELIMGMLCFTVYTLIVPTLYVLLLYPVDLSLYIKSLTHSFII